MLKKVVKKVIRKVLGYMIKFFYIYSSKDLLSTYFSQLSDLTELKKYDGFRSRYNIKHTFHFNGPHISLYGNGQIFCDEYSYIGSFSTIQAYDNCKVSIGKHTQISHNVRIYTQTNISDQDFNDKNRQYYTGDVIIKDYVWIGANVFINPGITIGENSIVGANAVVTKNVAPYTVVAGVPAKVIRYKSRNDE